MRLYQSLHKFCLVSKCPCYQQGHFLFRDVPGIPHGAVPPSSHSVSQQPSGCSEAVLHFLHCTLPTVLVLRRSAASDFSGFVHSRISLHGHFPVHQFSQDVLLFGEPDNATMWSIILLLPRIPGIPPSDFSIVLLHLTFSPSDFILLLHSLDIQLIRQLRLHRRE